MDLHNYKPALSEFDFSNFGYLESYAEPDAGWLAEMAPQFIRKTDEDQTAICVPLRGLGSFYTDRDTDSSNEEYDEKGGAHFLHHTPISLLLYAYYNPQKPIPGNYVILCPRAPEVFPGQPASIIDLPFTEEDWRRIVNMFHVSASIIRTVMRSVAYFSSGRNNASTKSGKRQLQISYTARMSDSLSDDLALSSTYHPHARTTYSIMYGCNKDHVQDIQRRIDSAGEDADHPLLMMGIFAELEYRRLIDEAEKIVDEFTLESDMLEQGSSWDPNSGKMQQHLEICLRSNTLADHIRTVKRQLAKVSTDIDDLIRYWQSREYISLWTQHNHLDKDVEKKRQERMIEIALQMSSRIRDIQDEYDDKIDECKKMAQNMSLAMQTGYNQIARRDAETNTQIARANTDIAIQTKRESSQMRNIALLTMVFLPLSCVASVFSTTIFNWDGEEGHPIVSGYIWVLLGIALILTIVTMLGWWFLTRRERKREGKEEKTKNKKDIDLEKGQQT